MGDINFTAILKEVTSLTSRKSYSTMYFGKHFGKNLILLQHEDITAMLVFNDQNLLVPEFSKTVLTKDGQGMNGVKIVGNGDMIVLLDSDGALWKLINAFEFRNEKEECFYMLEENCFYEWVPFKKFGFKKVIELSEFENGFACICTNKNLEKELKVLANVDSSHVEDYTFDELSADESQNYFLKNFKFIGSSENQMEIKKNSEDGLIIANKNQKIFICTKHSNTFVKNASNTFVVSMIKFTSQNFIIMCYQNGVLDYVHFNGSLNNVSSYDTHLPKKVVAIVKCECSDYCLIWSDGVNLHHTKFSLQNDKSDVKLVHLKVKYNIKGVKSIMKIHDGFIAVTNNNFYYHISINKLVTPDEIRTSPKELLCKIYERGLEIDKIHKDIEVITDFLEAKNMIQNNELCSNIEVYCKDECIIIKSNTKKVLKKEFWKIRLSATIRNNQHIEIKKLETDLSQGMMIKIESDLKDKVQISLLGYYGEEFDLLFVNLGIVERGPYEDETLKKVQELVKKRNTDFKI